MSYLIKDEKILEVIPKGFTITNKLTPHNWLVKYNEKNDEYYLQKTDSFKVPEKIYGTVIEDAKKYLKVFNSGDKNLGVLLRGYKGTGKSLTSKQACILSGLPVLIISEPFTGSTFLSFLDGITDDCIVFLDEFEKLYKFDYELRTNSQEGFLSIMDGSIAGGKKLFFLTANDGDIHSALLNRPGRIRYEVTYEGLSDELIEEVVDDLLKDSSKKADILYVFKTLGKVNIDSVSSVVEEVNNFPEIDTIDLVNSMNLFPEEGTYLCTWTEKQGVSMSSNSSSNKEKHCVISEHPLSSDDIYLGGSMEAIPGENYISIKECEILEVGDIVRLKYKGIVFKFTPMKKYRFKFARPELITEEV